MPRALSCLESIMAAVVTCGYVGSGMLRLNHLNYVATLLGLHLVDDIVII